ncbi:MAG: hypothetical protein R3A44_38195 [Caldilineaceae bacterium]
MRKVNWLTGALILTMPISLIFYLGVQMAYGQVQRRYESYAATPQIGSVTALLAQPVGETVLLRGEIAASASSAGATAPLLIFQERPRDGREVRYLEEFSLNLPEFALRLSDGVVTIQPSAENAAAISHELHSTPMDDRTFTGFQVGDVVTVQGKWQPAPDAQSAPRLIDVTGVSGADEATLLAEVQAGMQKVRLARDGLGLLTLASIVLLVVQLYLQRKSRTADQQAVGEKNLYADLHGISGHIDA